MSETLRQIMDMNVYNSETMKWEGGDPKTSDRAVYRADGTTVEAALNAIPGKIEAAVSELKGGVSEEGDTLAKLYEALETVKGMLGCDQSTLDAVQELLDYVNEHKTEFSQLVVEKINYSDIINALDAVSTVEGKVLDARQGKVLKDAIDDLKTIFEAKSEGYDEKLSGIEARMTTLATKNELNTVAVGAIPVISETPPLNPIGGQIWFKPIGTVEV